MANIDKLFRKIDDLAPDYISLLADAVAIPSVSAEAARRPDVIRMAHFLQARLHDLNAHVELRSLGQHVDPGSGKTLDLPPVIFARYPKDPDPKKRSIMAYGHYDVQPAELSDGWATDPFQLVVQDDGKLVGRGATDDKGPVLGWLNALRAHQEAGIDLPVNLYMCFEGMEENGSVGLGALIEAECASAGSGGFFAKVDAVCISDNYWLGTERPCLTYGLRGVHYYSLEVSGPVKDLHSGVYGGTVHEPMTDLVAVMGTLVKPDGTILIPGINDQVRPVDKAESALYPGIDFDMTTFAESLGGDVAIHGSSKERTLMGRWRMPSLSLHGIEGAFSSPGAKTVIPGRVAGKFSIRTVPDMDGGRTTAAVRKHVEAEFAKLKSKNRMQLHEAHAAGQWWLADYRHWNFAAGAKAVERVFKVKPDFTREGGSIPVTLTFEKATGKNVLLLPLGSSTDGAHSINEKIDRLNYIEGTKMMAAYLHYVSEEPAE